MKQYDYFFYCLGACGDGGIDIEEKIGRGRKPLINSGFRFFEKNLEYPKSDQKIAHREVIQGVFYRVVCRDSIIGQVAARKWM